MRSRLMGLAVLALSASTLASAQQGTGQRVMVEKKVRGPEKMEQMLNLTDEQEAKIEKLRGEMQRTMVQNRSKIQIARIDLRELMDADTPDRGAIEKKFKEISDIQIKQRMAMFDHHADIEKLLTPDQKKIWKEHRGEGRMEGRQRVMRRMGGRAGFGSGCGPECGPGCGLGSGAGIGQGLGMESGPGFSWTEGPDEEKDVLIFINEDEE
jgi:protein CpxP